VTRSREPLASARVLHILCFRRPAPLGLCSEQPRRGGGKEGGGSTKCGQQAAEVMDSDPGQQDPLSNVLLGLHLPSPCRKRHGVLSALQWQLRGRQQGRLHRQQAARSSVSVHSLLSQHNLPPADAKHSLQCSYHPAARHSLPGAGCLAVALWGWEPGQHAATCLELSVRHSQMTLKRLATCCPGTAHIHQVVVSILV